MIYDLTQLAYDDMSLFPETPPPSFTPIATVEQEGWHETMLHLTSHTGTHMDAPAHMIAGGATLDTMDVSRFMGRALVLDVSTLRGAAVTRELLEAHRAQLRRADFLLLRTGFGSLWGTPEYLGDFAVPTAEAMAYLAELHIRGVGIDALSLDSLDTAVYTNHLTGLGAGMIFIENLRLDALTDGTVVQFQALPLHYRHADGAPARAVAWDE